MKAMSVREQLPEGRSFVLNLEQGPVRPVHLDLLPQDRFGSLLVHFSEEALVVVSRVPSRGSGPRPHWHDVDQLFCCVSGALDLRLGEEDVMLTPGTMAVIPAGTRHSHRNAGDLPEIHLELIVPGIIPGRPVIHVAEPDEAWTERGQVIRPRAGAAPGAGLVWLAEAAPGSDARWLCGLLDLDRSDDVALPQATTAQRWYVIEGDVHVEGPTLSTAATDHSVIALPAESGARLRVAGGRRARLIGLWPQLSTADEQLIRAGLAELA
jgi:mannose-6-phosphate isomerase-like protein (cupin superfamily)